MATTLYRLLTGPDESSFCHKVSLALSKGWLLHGAPAYGYDKGEGRMMCAQAVIKEIDADYDPGMKLGGQ